MSIGEVKFETAHSLLNVASDEGDLLGPELLVFLFIELGGQDKLKKFFVGEVATGGFDVGVGLGEVGFKEGVGTGAGFDFGQQIRDEGKFGAKGFKDFAEAFAFETASHGVDRLEFVAASEFVDVGSEFGAG